MCISIQTETMKKCNLPLPSEFFVFCAQMSGLWIHFCLMHTCLMWVQHWNESEVMWNSIQMQTHQRCNLLMCLLILCIFWCFWAGFTGKVNFLWVKLFLEKLVKWWVLPMFLKRCRSAIVSWSPCVCDFLMEF